MAVMDRVGDEGVAVTAVPVAMTQVRHISWPAIFAGTVVVFLSQALFSLLGVAIGASTVDPLHEQNPFYGLGIGGGIWLIVSTLLSLYFGGWVAGWLARLPDDVDGMLHGVLTCGLSILLAGYVLGSVAGATLGAAAPPGGGGAAVLGRGAMAAGQNAGSMAIPQEVTDRIKDELRVNGIDVDAIRRDAEQVLMPDPKPGLSPDEIRRQDEQIRAVVKRVYDRGELAQADKDELINLVAARTGKNRDEVAQTVGRFEASTKDAKQKLDQAKQATEQKVREYGDKTATAVMKGASWSFVALLLGLAAAAMGGRVASGHFGDRVYFGRRFYPRS